MFSHIFSIFFYCFPSFPCSLAVKSRGDQRGGASASGTAECVKLSGEKRGSIWDKHG